MKSYPSRAALAALIAVTALGLGGCAKLRSHQGYVIDADLVNAVQPGVDNRESVLTTLGRPSFTGQFNDREWYYLSRDSRNYAYSRPNPTSQTTLKITFDAAGNVATIDRTGVEQVASVNPLNKETPTLGRKRGFFQDLFGNIGTVGAPGSGGGGVGGDGSNTGPN